MMLKLIGIAMLALVVVATGCVNVDYSFHPTDPAVQPLKEKELCAPQVLFLGPGGNITVQQAMKDGGITRVHSIEHGDYYFLLGGAKCTKVTGE